MVPLLSTRCSRCVSLAMPFTVSKPRGPVASDSTMIGFSTCQHGAVEASVPFKSVEVGWLESWKICMKTMDHVLKQNQTHWNIIKEMEINSDRNKFWNLRTIKWHWALILADILRLACQDLKKLNKNKKMVKKHFGFTRVCRNLTPNSIQSFRIFHIFRSEHSCSPSLKQIKPIVQIHLTYS